MTDENAQPLPAPPPFATGSRRRTLLLALAVCLALLLVSWFDRDLWRLMKIDDFARIEKRDWYSALRVVGYLPTWLVVAGMILIHDRSRARGREAEKAGAVLPAFAVRGAALGLSAALGGGLAELIKVVARRQRPGVDGLYHFGWLGEGKGPGWGMASSHAGVAFGGAFMLAMLFPAVRWPVLMLAAGCGVTRLLGGAHFASDVLVGAAAGWAGAVVVAKVLALRKNRTQPS